MTHFVYINLRAFEIVIQEQQLFFTYRFSYLIVDGGSGGANEGAESGMTGVGGAVSTTGAGGTVSTIGIVGGATDGVLTTGMGWGVTVVVSTTGDVVVIDGDRSRGELTGVGLLLELVGELLTGAIAVGAGSDRTTSLC